MQLGTNKEIEDQQAFVWNAEADLMKAKLRLRALKGEPLLASGDSFSSAALTDYLGELQNEFGARNLRMM